METECEALKLGLQGGFGQELVGGTCTLENFADDLALSEKDFGLSQAQWVEVARGCNAAKLARVSDGFTVDDGIARTSAKVIRYRTPHFWLAFFGMSAFFFDGLESFK